VVDVYNRRQRDERNEKTFDEVEEFGFLAVKHLTVRVY
jgi:hypothetical protein